VLLAVGCGKSGPADAPASTASAPESASPQTKAPVSAMPQSAAPVTSLDALLKTAESCVTDERVKRTCGAYVNLRRAVQARKDDVNWRGALLLKARADEPNAQTHLAIVLLRDGVISGPTSEIEPAVLPLLDASMPSARAAALRALAGHQSDAAASKALVYLEKDTTAQVREAAAYLLGRAGYLSHRAQSEPALLSALVNDSDPGVRRAVIGALGALQPQKAVKPLISLISHPQLGPNAAIQLGAFPQPEAYRAVLAQIARAKEGKPVSPSLVAALGRMRGKNKGFDAAEVRTVLTDVRPFLEKSADQSDRITLRMVDRMLKALPAAPASKAP
jgi:HEAT repeat protein